MAKDEEQKATDESAVDPTSDASDPTGGEQPAEELLDTEDPSTTDDESVAPASDGDESSDEEADELAEDPEPTDSIDPDGPDTDPEGDTDPDSDGERELVGAGVGPRSRKAADGTGETKSRNAAATRTKSSRTPSRKAEATPRQKRADRPKRTSPAQFVREAVGELRKVVYPTGPQLGNYFVVVLVFVLVVIGIVSLLDLGFGWAIFKVFA